MMYSPPRRPAHRGEFKIAIICALPREADAVEALFDRFWDEESYGKADGDTNAYTVGVIGRHNVVLAHMPGIGKLNAANVASSFRMSYGNVRLALIVGVCAGVPHTGSGEILLGDVVISDGIVQYDSEQQLSDNSGRPNAEIRSFLTKLKGRRGRMKLQDKTAHHLTALREKPGCENVGYPGVKEDKLFEASYRHKHQNFACGVCAKHHGRYDPVCDEALGSACQILECQEEKLVPRRRLCEAEENGKHPSPLVHFGLIASGDTVMKSGEDRDEISAREEIIAFEMEGAGAWENFPCVVIKGVCDYADSHKSKVWQDYAAATAAACMKGFLEQWVIAGELPSRASKNSKERDSASRNNANLTDAIQAIDLVPLLSYQIPTDLSSTLKLLSHLDSLAFPPADSRLLDIEKAHNAPFSWLFEKPEYKDWLDPNKTSEHNGFLWIKGKPGAERLTMMKYIIARAKDWPEYMKIISFFFHPRREELDKSTLGMYRSLLFQLLAAIPELQERFLATFSAKRKYGQSRELRIEELKSIFTDAVASLEGTSLIIFIDTLDECEENQVRDMVSFLEKLGEVAASSRVRLNICFSSRHYPHIGIKKGICLDMEHQQAHEQAAPKSVKCEMKANYGQQTDEIKVEISLTLSQ